MELLTVVIVAMLGAIIGSFLNVVILRLNTNRSLHGHSACASCGKPLGPLELVPVFSYIALRGRCKGCKSRILPQYVLIESLTAALFVLVFLVSTTILEVLFMVVVSCILVVILGYDMKHMIIPDPLAYTLIALGGLSLLFDASFSQIVVPTLMEVAVGPILFLFFYTLWKYSDGTWVGLGDGKLALGIGWILGVGGYSAFVLSFWIGAFVGLMLLAYSYARYHGKTTLYRSRKPFTMKSEVPFAPFLILGFYLVYAFHVNVLDIASLIA